MSSSKSQVSAFNNPSLLCVIGLGKRSVLCDGALQDEHTDSGRGLVHHGFKVSPVFLKFINFLVLQVLHLYTEGYSWF